MSKVQAELDETKIILVSREVESKCGNQRIEVPQTESLLSSMIVTACFRKW